MKKIIFPNGVYFVSNKKEIVNTLFIPGTTASGYYKTFQNGITFYDLQDNPFFHLVANPHNERFFVSCSIVDGKIWYMYAPCTKDEIKLGIDKLQYSEERNLAEKIWQDHLAGNKRKQQKGETKMEQIEKVIIVGNSKRTIYKGNGFSFIYIPLTKEEIKAMDIPNGQVNPCWRIEIKNK